MQHTRRHFLGVSAGAVGASMFGLARFAEAAKAAGFVPGVQSFSLRAFDADQAIAIAADLGYGAIEFYKNHLNPLGTNEHIDEVVGKAQDAGLKLMAHGVNRFSANEEENRQIFEFARRAGIKNLSAMPTDDAYESLERLVAEYDIRICLHNHGPKHVFNKIGDVEAAVEGRHPLIGACVDSGHFIRSAEDPVEAVQRLGPRVFGVHVKDFAEQADKAEEVIPGQGHLDVVGFFKALRDIDFPADGYVSVEYEGHKEDPTAQLEQCLLATKKGIRESRA